MERKRLCNKFAPSESREMQSRKKIKLHALSQLIYNCVMLAGKKEQLARAFIGTIFIILSDVLSWRYCLRASSLFFAERPAEYGPGR
jgi:hypothetical protein